MIMELCKYFTLININLTSLSIFTEIYYQSIFPPWKNILSKKLITKEDVKICFSEIFIVNVFSRAFLARNYMHGSTSIENISFSRNCDIKTKCEERHINTPIWVMFISKNSNTLEIEHSLLNSLSFPAMDFISVQLISLTNPIHSILAQFVHKSNFFHIRNMDSVLN